MKQFKKITQKKYDKRSTTKAFWDVADRYTFDSPAISVYNLSIGEFKTFSNQLNRMP
ncbi:MAG: hypothetical protein ACFFA3_16775 [Promethearchaeota archaeon]